MGLKTESIRQALLRTVESVSPTDPQLWKTIDEAYSLRSKILHDGLKEPYLNSWITRAECAIRKIYAGILNLPLSTPPFNDQ